ncbi:MAG: hypothetical protein JWN21_2078 [Sphingomonas bacterium]|nr:hypothetical protein [Sphingomonas bacterium]
MGVRLFGAATLAILLVGCGGRGEITDGGITTVRSPCPTVAVPAGTGDITLFDPPASRDATALDLTAVVGNLQSTCGDAGDQIVTTVTFDVEARRTRTEAARTVDLPYFITVVRGGSAVVAKRIGRVQLNFPAGQARAKVTAQASTTVARAAATLPEDVRRQLTRRRKAGEEDAAIDPLSQPEIRSAVLRASFEALVGFQLTDAQLRYNATR